MLCCEIHFDIGFTNLADGGDTIVEPGSTANDVKIYVLVLSGYIVLVLRRKKSGRSDCHDHRFCCPGSRCNTVDVLMFCDSGVAVVLKTWMCDRFICVLYYHLWVT